MGVRTSLGEASASTTRVKLRIGVAAVELAAQTSGAQPNATITSAQPIVAIQSVVAAVDIAYIDLTLSVLVDTNGFYKLFGDSTAASDAISLRSTKAAVDSVATSEVSVLSFGKSRSDNIVPVDVFSRIVGFNRSFVDAVTELEAQTLSVTKPLADTFTTPHAEVFAHQKSFVDGVAMNDGMEAVDGFGIALTRGVSNVTLVGDTKSLSFSTSRVESVAAQDSGSLRSQGYCDFSYFAEDYVGVALTF
jgi:hypothetical protein